MKTIVRFFFIVYCVNQALAYDLGQTSWTDTLTQIKYDFSSLQRDPNNPWKVKDGADNGLFSMIYYFNFGTSHNKQCKGQNVAVSEVLEILQQTTDTCEILGRAESRSVGLINPNNPNAGIYIQYGGGDSCSNSDNSLQNGSPRQTRFNVYCSKQQDEFKVDLPGGTQGTTKCLLTFKINSPAGCPGGYYRGFKGKAVLFWVLLFFGLYFAIGIIYNIRSNNLAGKEAIPNIEFWQAFPFYVKDGFVWSFGIFGRVFTYVKTKLFGESTANYSDI